MILRNGHDISQVSPEPLLEPTPSNEYTQHGIEDPKATELIVKNEQGLDDRVLACAIVGFKGVVEDKNKPGKEKVDTRIMLATSRIEDIERGNYGLNLVDKPLLDSNSKNPVYFPHTVKGCYVMFHRPEFRGISIAVSEYLNKDWVDLGPVAELQHRPGNPYDSKRVGPGPVLALPELDDHVVMFYHGVGTHPTNDGYNAFVCLIDKDNPFSILSRPEKPILSPSTKFERQGLIPNVIYVSGAVRLGDEILLYYGMADQNIGLATAKVSDLVRHLEAHMEKKQADVYSIKKPLSQVA
jgi:predicted GH43/DUF377 family glycosyl hydrolase